MKVGDKIVCIRDFDSDLEIGRIYNLLSFYYIVKNSVDWVEIDYKEGWGTNHNQFKLKHIYYEKSRFISLKEYRKLKLQQLESRR